MSTLPRVAVIGRTNVGKSTLFNRLTGVRYALVYDQPGVTRDPITREVSWAGKTFLLTDTGGLEISSEQDLFSDEIKRNVDKALQEADLILFVCDGSAGVTTTDAAIAKQLHKKGTPVVLVLNKADRSDFSLVQYEFASLGFTSEYPISAEHGTGIGDLLEGIIAQLPTETAAATDQAPACRVALLGKPNVGKSSLLNLILKKDAAIVSDIPGTTREAVAHTVSFYAEDIELHDTPGIRRKRAVHEPLEELMVKSAFGAVERADLVLLLVDAATGRLTDQELKLAFYTFEKKHKALMILFNKQDLTDTRTQETLSDDMKMYNHLFKRIAIMHISCKTGKNVGKVIPRVAQLCADYNQTLDSKRLEQVCVEALASKPLYHKTNRLILKAVKQVATGPITILLTVNEPAWFGPSQLKFFENIIRKEFGLIGVPVRFVARKTFA